MKKPISLWLNQREPLEAASLSLCEELRGVSTAAMTLTREPFPNVGQFVEIFDGADRSAGWFRVTQATRRWGEERMTLRLEHAMATLGDYMITHPVERIGGQETATAGEAIAALMEDFQFPPARWRFTAAPPGERYAFSFGVDNLLRAVRQAAEVIPGDWRWAFDFAASPWGLSIERAEEVCEMRMRRNIRSLRMTMDRAGYCNALLPLGSGGMTIAAVNGGAAWLARNGLVLWGDCTRVWENGAIRDPAILKASAEAELDRLCTPAYTVTVDGEELSALTGEALDRIRPGMICRIPLPDTADAWGDRIAARVVRLCWHDIARRPTDVTVTLSTARPSMAAIVAGQGRVWV